MEEGITLRQGLEKFHGKYKGHLSHHDKGISSEVKAFFMSHDIIHVLFGCDISLFGEGSVKIWTIFGTTLGFWKHLKEYQKASAYELSKSFSLVDVVQNIFKFLFFIPLLICRAKQMNKLWPWKDYDSYLDVPISVIRKEFNIKVLS